MRRRSFFTLFLLPLARVFPSLAKHRAPVNGSMTLLDYARANQSQDLLPVVEELHGRNRLLQDKVWSDKWQDLSAYNMIRERQAKQLENLAPVFERLRARGL